MSLTTSLIATARHRAGLTQLELARRAGTSQSAIALYEGSRRSPTMDTLQRILQAAGLELRVRLEVADDHDARLAQWFDSLPEAEKRRFLDTQRTRRAAP